MSHFYSGISGKAGPATREGSKASGIDGYVQSWDARLSVSMNHASGLDVDHGHFTLGAGPSNGRGGELRLDFRDVSAVVDALGSHDPRIEAIRQRIYREMEKLNNEAHAAIKRAARRQKIEENRRAREERAEERQRAEIVRDLKPEEKARLTRRLGVNWDASGNLESGDGYLLKRYRLRYEPSGRGTGFQRVFITCTPPAGWGEFDYDVSKGEWVLPFTPDDLGITIPEEDGYRVEQEHATA